MQDKIHMRIAWVINIINELRLVVSMDDLLQEWGQFFSPGTYRLFSVWIVYLVWEKQSHCSNTPTHNQVTGLILELLTSVCSWNDFLHDCKSENCLFLLETGFIVSVLIVYYTIDFQSSDILY